MMSAAHIKRSHGILKAISICSTLKEKAAAVEWHIQTGEGGFKLIFIGKKVLVVISIYLFHMSSLFMYGGSVYFKENCFLFYLKDVDVLHAC